MNLFIFIRDITKTTEYTATKNIMQKKFKIRLYGLTLLTALSLTSACSPVVSQRGNLLESYQTDEVKVGESTRSEVLRLLGSPTTQSTFNPNIWYYIGQETEKHGILDDEVVNENIVTVTFNAQGIVQSLDTPETERLDVPYVRTKTPTHGNDLTFMQQLLGNLGKFNTPSGSATEPAR